MNYNLFMLIGNVENITKNTIDLSVKGEHLEVIIEFEIPEEVTPGEVVCLSGSIRQDGLYGSKIVMLKGGENVC